MRIVADTTVLSFVADVLRVLLRIRTVRQLDSDAFWTRTARLVEGEDTLAGGFTLGPVGVSYQGGRVPAEAPLGTLYDVVAEGIERIEQQAFLVENGCPLAQGFLLGRPVPAPEMTKLLRQRV